MVFKLISWELWWMQKIAIMSIIIFVIAFIKFPNFNFISLQYKKKFDTMWN